MRKGVKRLLNNSINSLISSLNQIKLNGLPSHQYIQFNITISKQTHSTNSCISFASSSVLASIIFSYVMLSSYVNLNVFIIQPPLCLRIGQSQIEQFQDLPLEFLTLRTKRGIFPATVAKLHTLLF